MDIWDTLNKRLRQRKPQEQHTAMPAHTPEEPPHTLQPYVTSTLLDTPAEQENIDIPPPPRVSSPTMRLAEKTESTLNKWYALILIVLLTYCIYLFFTDINNAIVLLVAILSVSAFTHPIEQTLASLEKIKYVHRSTQRRKILVAALNIQRVYTIIISLLLLFIVLFAIIPSPFLWLQQQYVDNACIRNPTSIRLWCSEGMGVERVFLGNDTLNIGIIDEQHTGPFDKSRNNASEIDLEERIFAENREALKHPYMTLGIVTMLSRTTDDLALSSSIGIEDLKGAYLAQRNYNRNLQNTVKLRLVIANIGTRLTLSQTIAPITRQVSLLAKHDPSFRGIIGYPFSQSAKSGTDVLRDLGQTALPIISPSASSDVLSNIPNFYRIVSPDDIQSRYLAAFIADEFAPTRLSQRADKRLNIVVFSDKDDAYSESLKRDFIDNMQRTSVDVNIIPQRYEVGRAETLVDGVRVAVTNNVDAIFFSGYFDDLDVLESRLQAEQANQKKTQSIPIFGGDGLYDLNNVALNKYALIFSTTYAPPLPADHWFVADYSKTFNSNHDRPYINNYALIAPHAILAYDASNAFLQALIEMRATNRPTQDEFNSDLRSITYQGISGLITFQGANVSGQHTSDPLNKPVYLMCADKDHITRHAITYTSEKQKTIHLKHVLACQP